MGVGRITLTGGHGARRARHLKQRGRKLGLVDR